MHGYATTTSKVTNKVERFNVTSMESKVKTSPRYVLTV